MVFDQLSLLTAIGFSAAALMATLFVGWLGTRRDNYLFSWALGMAFMVVAVAMFVSVSAIYNVWLYATSFLFALTGFSVIHAGALQFAGKRVTPLTVLPGLMMIVLTIGAFLTGLSGVATIFANLGMGLLCALSGYQYWSTRREVPSLLISNAMIYFSCAVSFALCSVPILIERQWVMQAWPSNWAEDINSIVLIVGLTGVGALSLMLSQTRRSRQHRLEAMTDALTGLLNRRALFEAHSSGLLAAGTAVVMFDLDHFKTINDRLGHAGGDRVLQRFAEHLRENLRTDDSACRLGGEEFCAVLKSLTNRSAATVAERIRSALASDDFTGEIVTTVSAGVAIAGIEGEDFEAVLRRADAALYNAKSAGRNRVHAPGPKLVA